MHKVVVQSQYCIFPELLKPFPSFLDQKLAIIALQSVDTIPDLQLIMFLLKGHFLNNSIF